MSVLLSQPLEHQQQQPRHRDPSSMHLLRECDPSTGPCTPPLSPNDLSSSTTTSNDPDSTDLADPSTPPPSRSSTVKKTTQSPLTSHITLQSSIDGNDHHHHHHHLLPPTTDHNNQKPSKKDHAFDKNSIRDVDDPLSRQPSTSTSSSSDQVIIHRVSTTGNIEERQEHGGDMLAQQQHTTLQHKISRPPLRPGYVDTDDEDDDSKQLSIGTRIAKGHRHYTLMYDMLTGIRIAVGRVSAKLWRDLSDQDFRAAHKLVFDVTGNELTPGVKYDFKFKDYAPWVFRHLRERFRVDAADYMMSLTNKYILSELSSPGKSKSFFYYSRDCRFIIKTIHHVEHRFLRRILKQYYNHVCDNPNTLLSRFYGLHRIKLPRGRKIHFIVMGNVFPATKDLHLVFDLKGSTFGRFTPEERLATNPMTVLKDQNWIARSQKLRLGPEKRNLFIQQLERDIALLTDMNIMDYSMLVGIHDMERGNGEDPEDQHLHIVRTEHMGPADGTRRESKATFVRNALKNTNSRLLDKKELPKRLSMERKHCVFYADDGGFQATNDDNQSENLIYFVGIIDILTPYNKLKKTEHLWKSITQDKHTISSVPAGEYGERFMHFMKHAVTQ